ncbi:MAG TPA: MBG domain-containing protein, partial [Herpetosiphonaceae bacterium]|nr:MBG domain-containing protein [Herpetosiphonaceae bacterium]
VAIYGGFAGTETMLTQRDWTTNVVTLSGDLLGNDLGFANTVENSYHVVSTHVFADDAIIDGLTISGGNATGENGAGQNALGGGVYDSSINHTLRLTNVTISGNQAFNGGGIYNDRSTLILTNVTISGNTAVERGGGLYNAAHLPLTDVTISGNKARYGGGLFLGGYSPRLTNVVISGNTATEQGGGVYMSDWSPVLTNVTISGNTAQSGGGGIFNNTITPPSIRNSIIWGNSSGISNSGTTTPPISYSLVQDSGGSAAWNGSAGADGGGNLDADPLFVAPVPAAPSSGGDLHLLPNSPGIDAGSNAVANPGLPATDRDGDPRISNGVVNMGAYEALGWFTSQPPAAASYGSAYTHTFSASMPGQPGPITFALTAGALPPGLSLGPGGVLSGTPRAAGSYLGLAITASSGSSSYTQRFTLTVARAPLTITANGASRSYGQANPGFTAHVSGFVLEDNANVLSSWIQYSTPATGASPAGSYPITPGGTTAANYAITFVPGTLTVTPAPLTITANDANRPYGKANPAFTAHVSGFVLGEDASVLSSPIQFSTPATGASPAGSYPITPGGAAAANYAITFVPGTLTVTAPTSTTASVFLPLVVRP